MPVFKNTRAANIDAGDEVEVHDFDGSIDLSKGPIKLIWDFFRELSQKRHNFSNNCIELEQEKCFQLVDLFFGTVFQVIYRNWVRLILTVKLLTLLAHHPWVIWVVVIIT